MKHQRPPVFVSPLGLDEKSLKDCWQKLLDASTKARAGLSSREKVAFAAGLRASHAEEALTQGDVARANAHFQALLGFMAQLETMPR